MPIPYEVESLDGVDEAVKGLYTEADGKFRLDIQGAVPESRYNEQAQKAVDAATEAQRRRKTIERVTQKLGLQDASGLDEALEALLSKSTKGAGGEDQEAIVAQIKSQSEAQIAKMQQELQRIKMDGAKADLTSQLIAVGFPAKAAEMFAVANMGRVQLDDSGALRILSDKNTPLAGSGADGFAVMADLAKELAAAMPEFLVDAGKGGGGKPPASGAGTSGVKTVTRSQFDAMSQSARADFAKQGGKVVDG